MFAASSAPWSVTLVSVPLFEYRCGECASVFEVLRPMADRELAAVCPRCESRASMPLISRFAALTPVRTAAGPEVTGGAGGGCCGGTCGCGAN
jgi:putative FmdB family regulatory protein